jgi:drug/metabolite transporter (DMT)-like permease
MSSDLKNSAAVKPAAWLVGACLLAVYIVWGTTYFAIKVAIEGIAPFFLVGTRFVAAGVLLLGWQALRGAPAPTARQWGGAALVGFLLLVVGNGAVSVAEHWVSSGATVALISITSSARCSYYLARYRGRWVRCFHVGWIFRMARPDSARRC